MVGTEPSKDTRTVLVSSQEYRMRATGKSICFLESVYTSSFPEYILISIDFTIFNFFLLSSLLLHMSAPSGYVCFLSSFLCFRV